MDPNIPGFAISGFDNVNKLRPEPEVHSVPVSDEHPLIHIEFPEGQGGRESELEPLDIFAANNPFIGQSGRYWDTHSPIQVSPSPSVASMASNSPSGHAMLGVPFYARSDYSNSMDSLLSNGSISPSMLSLSPHNGSSDLGGESEEPLDFGEFTRLPNQLDDIFVAIQDNGGEPTQISVGFPQFPPPEQKQFLAVDPQIHRQRRFSSSDDLTAQDMSSLMAAAGEMPGTGDSSRLSVKDKFMRYLSAANKKFRPRVQKKGGASAEASKSRRLCDPKWVCIVAGCDQDFTRKNGLMNHYRAHLQISHLACRKCGGLFRNSLRRHEKTCKGDKQMS